MYAKYFKLQSFSLFFPFVDNFTCFCGNGMVESMLEPHLKNYAGASQFEVSMTFLILGGCYSFVTPFAGYVSYFQNPKTILIC